MNNQPILDENHNKRNAVLLILLTTVAYALSCFGRKTYDANINEIMSFFNVEKDVVGLAGTAFFIAYGIGQVVHGLLCTKYNPKYSILIALAFGGACNLAVGLLPASGFRFVKYIWLINGFSQAVLWSSTVLIFTRFIASEYSRLALLIMCFPTSVGFFIAYGLSALFSAIGNFKLIYYVSAFALFGICVVWLLSFEELSKRCLQAKLISDGRGAVNVASAENSEKAEGAENAEISQNAVNAASAEKPKKKNKLPAGFLFLFVVMSLLAIINNLVKDGLNTWSPTFLKERFGLENWTSVLLTLVMPLFAMFGNGLALFLNRKIKSLVLMSGVLYIVSAAAMGVFLVFFNKNVLVVALICFALTACLMAGVNNIVTAMFPMECKGGINAGLVAGLIDGCCYLGSALSSYGFGAIAESLDWRAVMTIIFAALAVAAASCAFCFFIENVIKKRKSDKY